MSLFPWMSVPERLIKPPVSCPNLPSCNFTLSSRTPSCTETGSIRSLFSRTGCSISPSTDTYDHVGALKSVCLRGCSPLACVPSFILYVKSRGSNFLQRPAIHSSSRSGWNLFINREIRILSVLTQEKSLTFNWTLQNLICRWGGWISQSA